MSASPDFEIGYHGKKGPKYWRLRGPVEDELDSHQDQSKYRVPFEAMLNDICEYQDPKEAVSLRSFKPSTE